MALKYSKQRAIIMDFLKDRKDHPTADVVYTNVRKILPNISLGTVYRNLMLLTELGEIKKIQVGDGVDHFDPTTGEHDHFVCTECGGVFDLPVREAFDAVRYAGPDFDGEITGYTLNLRGVCAGCLAKEHTA